MSGSSAIDARPDAATLARIRDAWDTNFLVEASAGSGKTTALVGRIVYLIVGRGIPLSRIAALTFTEKAAAQMKERLRQMLVVKARSEGEVGARAAAALREIERATVCTIHSFCGEILRRHPFEAGIDPGFHVIDEDAARSIYDGCFEEWFPVACADAARFPGVARLLRRRSKEHADRRGAAAILEQAGWSLAQVRDFAGSWSKPTRDRTAEFAALLADGSAIEAMLAGASDRDSWLGKSLQAVVAASASAARRVDAGDLDGAEEELRGATRGKRAGHFRWVGGPRTFATVDGVSVPKDEVLAARDAWKVHAQRFVARADGELASLLREDLRSLLEGYEQALASQDDEAGRVDFLELLLAARRLVGTSYEAREAVASRYDAFLVDEFQDTDPVQAELLLLLSANDRQESDPWKCTPGGGRLFLVGDPKQSIYRFRRADPKLYARVAARILETGGEHLSLVATHRFRGALAQFVDGAFAPLFGASYTNLAPCRAEHLNPLPTVVALPVPAPFSTLSGKPSNWAIELSFPDAVAAFVQWLVRESGYTVYEGGKPVRVAERHICLLFKRMSSFGEDTTRPYVAALDGRGLLHAATGPRGFFAREEVRQLLAALRAIDDPLDEFQLFAALRGALFAFSDEALLAAHQGIPLATRARRALLEPVSRDAGPAEDPVEGAIRLLVSLHHARDERPFAETVDALVDALAARITLAFRPAAEQALANLDRFGALARREDDRATVGFRNFVARLQRLAERGGTEEGRIAEEGGAGVALVSVHRAKGLEYPVVILCDPTAPQVFEDPGFSVGVDAEGRPAWMLPIGGLAPWALHEERATLLADDEAEARRLLYVACTRARDLLVVPTGPDGPIEGWMAPLSGGLLPPPGRRSRPEPFVPAGKPFGEVPFAVPSHDDRGDPRERLRPGLFYSGLTGAPVVVWDPNALPLGAGASPAGVRAPELLAAPPGNTSKSLPPPALEADRAALAQALAQPALLPATTLAKGGTALPASPSSEVAVVRARGEAPISGARGPRIGNLVHQILQHTPTFLSDDPSLEALALALAGRLSATDEERVAALGRVRKALAHASFEALRSALDVRREQTVVLPADRHAYGTVDVAYRDADGWVVVDYKSDADPIADTRLAAYREQLALYTAAFAVPGGGPVRAVILLV